MSCSIRVIALAIIRRPESGELLVFEGKDPGRELTYHRPLGGGVEFGELGAETVRRELREEIGVEIEVGRQLAFFESIFEFNGDPKHEIVFAYECAFADPGLYGCDRFEDLEGRGEDGIWRPLDDPTLLVPEPLTELLRSSA